METRNQTPSTPLALLSPLEGWEVAARWNRATFDWMAKGWQQWLALVTTMPPHWIETLAPSSSPEPVSVTPAPLSVTPAQAGAQKVRAARSRNTLEPRLRGNDEIVLRAVAKADPKRPARAKAKSRNSKSGRARTRG